MAAWWSSKKAIYWSISGIRHSIKNLCYHIKWLLETPANPNRTICGWNFFCQGYKYPCFIPTSSFKNLYQLLDLDLTFVGPNKLKYFVWKCTMTASWLGTSSLPILLVTKMWPTWNFITLSLWWAKHISHLNVVLLTDIYSSFSHPY